MRALLVSPGRAAFPSRWGALPRFLGVPALMPPLGLLTVASLLPAGWSKRLIDLDVRGLADEDLRSADLVLVSANDTQRRSARDVLRRCRALGVRTVGGGPLFTFAARSFPELDHVIAREAETNLPPFLADLASGRARSRYDSEDGWADLTRSPVPDWSLIDPRDYSCLSLQTTRGCPHRCTFCSVTSFLGREIRTKSAEQVGAELEALYAAGWRKDVFLVDDNFIADPDRTRRVLLPALTAFQSRRNRPFRFRAQVTLDLADDPGLLDRLVEAGFVQVFIGLESPSAAALRGLGKGWNARRDMKAAVGRIQSRGLRVIGGFMIGLEEEPPSAAADIIRFIEDSGLIEPHIAPLRAIEGTALYDRLSREGRVVPDDEAKDWRFNNITFPATDPDKIARDRDAILRAVYAPRAFYARAARFLAWAGTAPRTRRWSGDGAARTALRVLWLLGVRDPGRARFWTLLGRAILRRRGLVQPFVETALQARAALESAAGGTRDDDSSGRFA